MTRVPRFKRSAKPITRPASARAPWKERLVVTACILGLMGVLALLGTVAGIGQQREALDKQLARWKAQYHLTDDQAARIRQIELGFHGNGNPFTSRDSGTAEEDAAHHLEIARVMDAEDGERFLRDIMHKKGQH